MSFGLEKTIFSGYKFSRVIIFVSVFIFPVNVLSNRG
jgi:hypothetical protein